MLRRPALHSCKPHQSISVTHAQWRSHSAHGGAGQRVCKQAWDVPEFRRDPANHRAHSQRETSPNATLTARMARRTRGRRGVPALEGCFRRKKRLFFKQTVGHAWNSTSTVYMIARRVLNFNGCGVIKSRTHTHTPIFNGRSHQRKAPRTNARRRVVSAYEAQRPSRTPTLGGGEPVLPISLPLNAVVLPCAERDTVDDGLLDFSNKVTAWSLRIEPAAEIVDHGCKGRLHLFDRLLGVKWSLDHLQIFHGGLDTSHITHPAHVHERVVPETVLLL